MSNGAFLLIALGLSVAGSLLIWLFNRKPKTFMSSIDDFSREMKALGRETEAPAAGRRWKRTVHPPGREPADEPYDPDAPIDLDAPHDDGRTSGPTEERRS